MATNTCQQLRALQIRRMAIVCIAAGLVLCVSACGDEDATNDAGVDAGDDVGSDTETDATQDVVEVACWDDIAPGELQDFVTGLDNSEGISFGPGGFMYVSSDDAVYRVDGAGVAERFAELPHATGLAASQDGSVLWIADIGASFNPGVADGTVQQMVADGTLTNIATGIDSPNFVVVLPDGSVLISDDFDTIIWHVALDGTVTQALDTIDSPNGMAYAPDGNTLYVASTFTNGGEITAVDVDATGRPMAGTEVVLAALGAAATPDGIVVDADGAIYVAANLQREIVRLVPGEEPTPFATDIAGPASLAFGQGDDFDPCSLYVTELFGDRVVRVGVGTSGAPLVPAR